MNPSLICLAGLLALPMFGLAAIPAAASGEVPSGAVVTSTSITHVTLKTSTQHDLRVGEYARR